MSTVVWLVPIHAEESGFTLPRTSYLGVRSNQSGHTRLDETTTLPARPQPTDHQPSPFIPLFQWPCTSDWPTHHLWLLQGRELLAIQGRAHSSGFLIDGQIKFCRLTFVFYQWPFLLATCQRCPPFSPLHSEKHPALNER